MRRFLPSDSPRLPARLYIRYVRYIWHADVVCAATSPQVPMLNAFLRHDDTDFYGVLGDNWCDR